MLKEHEEQEAEEFIDTCSNHRRLHQLQFWCDKNRGVNDSFEFLESLDSYTLRTLVKNIIVDEKHNVLYCNVPKAG